MGSVADLLAAALSAGLTLEAHGDRIRITGPKSAEAIVRQIQARKAEVLVALAQGVLEPLLRAEAKERQRAGGGDQKSEKAKSLRQNSAQPIHNHNKARDELGRIAGGKKAGRGRPHDSFPQNSAETKPNRNESRDELGRIAGVSRDTIGEASSNDQSNNRMARAFQAAGLPVEMPADPDQARARLHALMSHRAPRPEGLPSGVDLVVLMGGRHPGPRLVGSFEPWAFGRGAVPIRWRRAGDPSTAWRALAVNPAPAARPDSDGEDLDRWALDVLERDGPLTPEDLGPRLEVNPVAALRPLHRLEAAGRVVRLEDGRWRAVRP